MGRTADVAVLAERRLRGKPYLALQGVSCSFQDGVLTLQGLVNTEPLRRIAAAVVGRLPGVGRVANGIEVAPHPADGPHRRCTGKSVPVR